METLSYCQLMQRCGELEAQLHALLAAYEQEPAAWRYRTTDINGNPNPGWSFSEEASLLGLYQPLYTHPAPSIPAVLDEQALSDLRERLADVVGVRFSNDDDVLAIFDVCRAAMLNGGKS